MIKEKPSKNTNKTVRERLFRNRPAVFGLLVIVFAHVVALLGYLIMPDHTPNANDGSVQIPKRLPGHSSVMLKIRKDIEVERVGILQKMMFGQESEYTIVPIESYELLDDSVFFTVGRERTVVLSQPLVTAVHAIPFLPSSKFPKDQEKNFMRSGDSILYLDMNEKIHKQSFLDLQADFENHNIEKRTFWLGTSRSGRDMLSLLILGTRISLTVGFIAVVISLFVGISLGSLAGFFGGRIDAFISWFMTVIWSIPSIMLVIAITMALGSRGVFATFLAVGLTMWVDVARIVRGQMMATKEKLYIEAAKAFGVTNLRIIFRHILPNIMGPIIVTATANFASAILVEAGLSFLGLGVQPPAPSWGSLVKEGYDVIASPDSWHLIVFPSAAICILVLAFNLLGNGLRDAYDPQKRH